MQSKLKAGVIGTGSIFNALHGPAWQKHPEVELVAACDIVPGRADAFAATADIKNVYTDYRKLLAMEEIDFVDICTPNHLHSEIAVAALQAGKHVLCEKPDAINPDEARRMAQAAHASGKTLLVMRNNRFNPAARYLRQYINEGQMGEIYAGRCGWIRRRGIPGRGGWFTTKSQSGGGPLIDLGVHFIDLAMWLMGNPRPVAVTGATYCKFAESSVSDSPHVKFGETKEGGTFDVEDLAMGFIRFDNGASLQIEFSWASNVEEEANFVELRGTRSGCRLRNGQLRLFSESAGALCDLAPRLPATKLNDHAANLHHFIDVIRGRAEPTLLPEQGVQMIQILSAIYTSAQTGAEVRL